MFNFRSGGNPIDVRNNKVVQKVIQGTVIPSGIICMWSGTNATIPSGWALCDGSGGTPNLTDKFIVGSGNTYTTGDTGGSATITTTVDNSTLSTTTSGTTAGTDFDAVTAITDHNHTASSSSNLPPYYALAYIIKL